MTLRLLILGNSHLTALADGWRANPGRWSRVSAHFVGAHGERLLETDIRDGQLRPTTAEAEQDFSRLGGGGGVVLGNFDGIVIAGGHIALAAAATLWRELRWAGLPSLANTPDLAVMAPALVSRRAALATLEARLATRLGIRLAARLRAACDLPIWITCQPRVSEVILDQPRRTTRSHAAALTTGDAPALSALFDEAAATVSARAGATFVPQPPQTITHHILTARPFMEGANRLTRQPGRAQPLNDIMHANGDWGAVMLDAVMAAATNSHD